MKLTWEINPEDSRSLLLMVDGDLWKEVYKNLFIRQLGSLSRCISLEDLEAKFSLIEEKVAKAESLRLLSAKSRFSRELEEKLSAKGLSDKAIQKAIAECQRLGYLNDREESERLAQKLQRKGYGASLIAAKMKAKGGACKKEMLGDPAPIIRKLYEKKLRSSSKEKAIASLLRRGFDYATIVDALNPKDFL